MSKRYMLIPWSQKKQQAGDFMPDKDRAKWQKQTGKSHTLVYANDRNKSVFKFSGETRDIVIYVRGHGDAGADSISSTAKNAATISADDLCEMLIGFGLQTTFEGRIKFYNCESAVEGKNGELSFAARCAAHLRKKEYEKASYYGYTASVSGFYTEHGGAMHRWVTIQGSSQPALYIGDTLLNGVKPTVARASAARVAV